MKALLGRPDDQATWLVLADWLEDQGEPASAARARLLRLQADRARARDGSVRQRHADKRAAALLARHPGLVGSLQPLCGPSFPVLGVPSALALFLLADQAAVVGGPLADGTAWEGSCARSPTPSRRHASSARGRATTPRGTWSRTSRPRSATRWAARSASAA